MFMTVLAPKRSGNEPMFPLRATHRESRKVHE